MTCWNVQFSILEVSASFSDVEVIAVPETCLVKDLKPLGTIQAIFVRKERFDHASLQNNSHTCQLSRIIRESPG